ncbi:MAG: WG repeat-containing protein [Candidatus Obscuribacterales bacterium]
MRTFSGDPVGLTDASGRVLIPTNFSKIEYVGNGLFIARTLSDADKYECGSTRLIFNRKGQKLDVVVPEGGKLLEVLWLGDDAARDPKMYLDRLPDDALFRFSANGKLGICDTRGKLIEEPLYSAMGVVREGHLVMRRGVEGRGTYHIFDLKTRKRVDVSLEERAGLTFVFSEGLVCFHTNAKMGYMDADGKIVIEPKFRNANSFVNGKAAVITAGENKSSHYQIIDKTGKVISPDDLNVEGFTGDYAVAWPVGGKERGIVDSSFRFVIPPVHPYISGRPKYRPPWEFREYRDHFADSPTMFIAPGRLPGRLVALSVSGDVLFDFPEGIGIPVESAPGGLSCLRQATDSQDARVVWLDSTGKFIQPDLHTPKSKGATFTEIAPGLFRKTILTDSGRFDPKYWAEGRVFPISRMDMFNRLLRENNLIGMTKETLLKQLGMSETVDPRESGGEIIVWLENNGRDDDRDLKAKFLFEGNQVSGWCFTRLGGDSPLVKTNDVISPASISPALFGNKFPYTLQKSSRKVNK